jgi:hypothetical protein
LRPKILGLDAKMKMRPALDDVIIVTGTVQQIKEVVAKIQLGFGINPNQMIGSHCKSIAITIA